MNDQDKDELLALSWQIHSVVEQAYQQNPAVQGDTAWLDKQRVLLADMALHLLQTALNAGELDSDKLKNNLYSVMTISDQFIPHAKLNIAKEEIYK